MCPVGRATWAEATWAEATWALPGGTDHGLGATDQLLERPFRPAMDLAWRGLGMWALSLTVARKHGLLESQKAELQNSRAADCPLRHFEALDMLQVEGL